ncbi:MAG: hypothetical protein L3J57_15780 [Desulfuromusa sp.]|nr:hypothetical protein [Desulfuromusa sp.]
MTSMQRTKMKFQVWGIRVMILLGCFVGAALWLSAGSKEGSSLFQTGQPNLAHADQKGEVPRPEIDLRTPDKTEIALFALG